MPGVRLVETHATVTWVYKGKAWLYFVAKAKTTDSVKNLSLDAYNPLASLVYLVYLRSSLGQWYPKCGLQVGNNSIT